MGKLVKLLAGKDISLLKDSGLYAFASILECAIYIAVIMTCVILVVIPIFA
jgi:hypothetical protein